VEDVLAVAWIAGHPRAEPVEVGAQLLARVLEASPRLGDFLTEVVVHGTDRTIAPANRIRAYLRRGSFVWGGERTPMLIYYDWNASPNCLKTKILLHELAIEYEQRTIDRAILQGAEYRARFPTGQAPAIEDGEVRISESSAIAYYLADKHGALVPSDRVRRARMYQAMSLEAALVAPTLGGQGLFGELYKPEAERHAPRVAELQRKAQWVAQVLGAVLGDRPFFADELSIADIQLYAATAKGLDAGVFEDPPSNLVAWCARMTDRPSVARAREQYLPYRRAA
jgi:glutathione S-transferase